MFPTFSMHIEGIGDKTPVPRGRRWALAWPLELHVIPVPDDRGGSVAWLALEGGTFCQFLKVGRA